LAEWPHVKRVTHKGVSIRGSPQAIESSPMAVQQQTSPPSSPTPATPALALDVMQLGMV